MNGGLALLPPATRPTASINLGAGTALILPQACGRLDASLSIANYLNQVRTAADRGTEEAQAVVASDIIRDSATVVSNAIGRPATVLETYTADHWGIGNGVELAEAPASESLSSHIPASHLANNNMTGWTVGQYRNHIGARLGGAANQIAAGPS